MLVCEPPREGRAVGGPELDGREPPAAARIRAPRRRASRPIRRRTPRGGDEVHEDEPRQHQKRLQHLVRKANPTNTPAATTQRVRPLRARNHAAQAARQVSRTIIRASGLLYRNNSVATGVTASTGRRAGPPRPEPPAHRGGQQADRRDPMSACGTSTLQE